MDMWNWLMDLFNDGYINIEDLERIMTNDKEAYDLYREFVDDDMRESINWTRSEVEHVLEYLKKITEKKNGMDKC